ncbi:PREDICTED: uncharacterized protein LOC108367503, partial [Rhagoletis zephyria]|uniref:uncharacterized protein LOC108367503 n=1 Tax=Rhagoletis zephyria TaxID=28612 RepID=UPI000811298E
LLGSQRIRTTPYHPCANGMIERWHRSLKTALMCHNTNSWMEVLPIVLLGLRSSLREDVNASPAELVYGTSLKLPCDFFNNTSDLSPSDDFVKQLKSSMNSLRPIEVKHKSNRSVFVHKDLASCTHVYVRQDSIKKSLQPPYDGPYLVLSRNDKVFNIKINDSTKSISIDRLKPAFMFNTDICEDPRSVPVTVYPNFGSRIPRHVRFRSRLQH